MPSRRSNVPRGLRALLPYLSKPGTPGFWVALIVVGILLWQMYRAQDSDAPLPPPSPQDTSSAGQISNYVQRVVDGDTLVMGDETRIRLIGVDTPETKKPNTPVQPFGPEATAFTQQHVEGRTVRLVFDKRKTDKYGRVLAFVYVDDWFLNEELLRAGLAKAELGYSFDKQKKQIFRAAEKEAQTARRGLWSQSN